MCSDFTHLSFSNSFAQLGQEFFSRVKPTPLVKPQRLIHANSAAAGLLDIAKENISANNFTAVFSGKQLLPGADPLAMLYGGHQFGHWVPQLGDGRAIMLGELTNAQDEKWEIQLKGSGQTPYSRDGDGRAVLRSTIREYLCSEAMHGLNIPTTRALCIIGSDDEVYRENIETAAILTRLAPSHIRFGSFEVFYYRNQFAHIKTLADYVLAQHYPELVNHEQPYLAMLEEVIERTASLIASWQGVGFCHGVMNSDNMSILGLTLDYGPFGFMEAFDPKYICNLSDYQGRYAYNEQPQIGLFNVSCLAQAMLPLFDDDPEQAAELAKEKLSGYQEKYENYFSLLMQRKLGLTNSQAKDRVLINDLFTLMTEDKTDFSILFRRLCDFSTTETASNTAIRDLFMQREAFDSWATQYRERLLSENSNDAQRAERMKQINPKFILRNYMAEIAIRKAEDEQDYSEIDKLMTLLQTPFAEHPEHEAYAGFPPDWADNISVSCSS